ncbi:hypothetical protein ASG21_14500 [Chryseobacterium sp. Leaf394]|nr:hypothetical protein ASG21_14500 [Chryseobacterium sp. Leaf394]
MNYKYSICYPNQKEIEHRNEVISANEVISIAKNYPWEDQLMLLDSLKENSVYYNPSLDFICLSNKRSFGLTAEFSKNKELEFSLWYDRPKKVRFLFGILGHKERMVLNEVSSVDFEMSLMYLGHFVKGNYLMLEKLYHK